MFYWRIRGLPIGHLTLIDIMSSFGIPSLLLPQYNRRLVPLRSLTMVLAQHWQLHLLKAGGIG